MAKTPRINITSTTVSSAPYIKQSDLNPVGMIVSSMLTETQFQSLNGTSWVLMDGRSIAGSAYATVTGLTTIADGRGLVLRGKNNGGSALGLRADGSQNPDGDLALGVFQSHATAKNGLGISDPGHTHSLAQANGGQVPAGPFSVVQNSSGLSASSLIGGAGTGIGMSTGDNETRMRNITVNHFIKINP